VVSKLISTTQQRLLNYKRWVVSANVLSYQLLQIRYLIFHNADAVLYANHLFVKMHDAVLPHTDLPLMGCRLCHSETGFHPFTSGNGHHAGISEAGASNGRTGASFPYPKHAQIFHDVGGVGFSLHRGHLKHVVMYKYRVIPPPSTGSYLVLSNHPFSFPADSIPDHALSGSRRRF